MKAIKPPTLAEVIQLRQVNPDSLEARAASINRHIDLYLRADASQSAHRLRAGIELKMARDEVAASGWNRGWEAWCADNIHRSMRDIRRLMKIAGADDPEAAAEAERSNNQAAQQRSRANRTDVSPAERLFQQFLQLDAAERAEFLSLVKKEMQ